MAENKRDTQYLNVTPNAQPMPDRPLDPGTSILTPAWLIVFNFGGKKMSFPVGRQIVVGREPDAGNEEAACTNLDLSPHGGYQAGVSREHARITYIDGILYIEDLGSSNGTRINGFQLTPERQYRLRDGDELEFAGLRVSINFVPRPA